VSSALNVTGYFCRFPLMLHSLFQEVYPFLAFLLVEVLVALWIGALVLDIVIVGVICFLFIMALLSWHS
jgi:hypothetical protein